MAVTSEVQLCNNALLRLGTNTITSLTDGTTAANACNQAYSPTRDALLRMHLWNFAIKRTALAADVATPSFEFNYQYTLPVDFIRVHRIYNQTSPFTIEGPKLISDQAAPLNLVYVSRITDVTKFDPIFTEALILALMLHIGPRIQGDGYVAGDTMRQYKDMLITAQIADAQDGTPINIDASTFMDARDGGGGAWWNDLGRRYP